MEKNCVHSVCVCVGICVGRSSLYIMIATCATCVQTRRTATEFVKPPSDLCVCLSVQTDLVAFYLL